jgi:hypothetical protein
MLHLYQAWVSSGAVANGSPYYVAYYLACIKFRDISDYFKKCPMQKKTKGFIYVNYNSSTTSITTSAAGGVASSNIATFATNINFGQTCPVLYNWSSAGSATALNAGVTAAGLAIAAATTLE